MEIQLIILLISFICLVYSADKFVYGAASLAKNVGISPMVIGLTIVAMGSSAPEMMVSATASLQGAPNTAIGNALGSNITNIALVLGITALFKPLEVSSSTLKRELPLALVVTFIAYLMLSNEYFGFAEGVALFIGFFIFIATLLIVSLKQKAAHGGKIDDPMILEAETEIPDQVSTPAALLWLGFGMILLPLSANYLVESATFIARHFGVSDLVIGLTVIAIGTSLPELAACIMSVIKKEADLAMGNIIGSNIFNILAVLSLAGIIAPGVIDGEVVTRDAPFMLGITVLLLMLCFSLNGRLGISRVKGFFLVLLFFVYQYLIFSNLTA